MNDPRQRAPFAHQSSSLDLRGSFGQQQVPARQHGGHAQWTGAPMPLNGGGAGGMTGGPGYFPSPIVAPASAPGPSRHITNAVNTFWKSVGMERKASDDAGAEYDKLESGPSNGGVGLGGSSGAGGVNAPSLTPAFSLNTPPAHHRSLSSSLLPIPAVRLDAIAHSLPSALPSPQTVKFILLCSLWYVTSAVSSNTGKVILNNFKFPVTLTIVQFAFVAGLCWLGSRRQLGWTSRLRRPTQAILWGTLPMAGFQVGGHIFSSLAISRVPVSTVHTIKALSPLFTVLAYALLFGVSYSPATYLSLLPLTLGVMLACSFDLSFSNFVGLVCAFGSTVVFVSQNIFFKKVMPTTGAGGSSDPSAAPKLDKINLLYFSSGTAFFLMIPIWLYSDALRLFDLWLHPAHSSATTASVSTVTLYMFVNGTVHFAQNLLAFAILASTSPVTYSIASLVKRIAVICLAIVWFKQAVHIVQALGIALTAIGLYMYNNAKRDVEKGEKRMRQVEAVRDGMLPTTKSDQRILEGRSGSATPEPSVVGLSFYGGQKDAIHASPRPSYPSNFSTNAHSTSTAVRPVPPPYALGLSLAPASAPAMVPSARSPPPLTSKQPPQTPAVDPPYPSPPASTSSSPPQQPVSIIAATAVATATDAGAASGTARRRLSNDHTQLASISYSANSRVGASVVDEEVLAPLELSAA